MEGQNNTPKAKSAKRAETLTEQRAKAAVDKFIDQHLRNSNFSLDTPAWNHFQAGLPVLIGCIVTEMED
jgi:hypothetical protein